MNGSEGEWDVVDHGSRRPKCEVKRVARSYLTVLSCTAHYSRRIGEEHRFQHRPKTNTQDL